MKFDLEEAMVWWGDYDSGHAMRPQIKVLSNKASGNSQFSYLENSVGACFGGWRSLSEAERAAALFGIYTWAVGRDRVPADEAHNEFLKIAAYREWCEKDTGPFSEIYGFAHGQSFENTASASDSFKKFGDLLPSILQSTRDKMDAKDAD